MVEEGVFSNNGGERGALCHEIQARKSGPNHNNMRNMHFFMKNKKDQTVLFCDESHIFVVVIYICLQIERSQSSAVPPLSPSTVPEFTSFPLQSPWKPELKENTLVLSWCLRDRFCKAGKGERKNGAEATLS